MTRLREDRVRPEGGIPSARGSGVRSEGRRAILGIGDQALFAATSLLVTVILGRTAGVEVFSAFAASYSAYLLLLTLHSAFITEPALIGLANRPLEEWSAYESFVLTKLHRRFVVASGGVLLFAAICAWIVESKEAAVGLLAAAAAQAPMLRVIMRRRLLYAEAGHQIALRSSAIYSFAAVSGMLGLAWTGRVTTVGAWAMLACAAVVADLLTPRLYADEKSDGNQVAPIAEAKERRRHWWHGRWAGGNAALTWIPMNLPFVVGPTLLGAQSTAELRAGATMIQPAFQLLSALGWVLIASGAKGGRAGVGGRAVKGLVLASVAAGAVYGGIVLFGAPLWLDLLFGGRYTAGGTVLLRILAVGVPFIAAAAMLNASIRSIGRPDRATTLSLVGAVPTIVCVGVAVVRPTAWLVALGIVGSYCAATVTGMIVARTSVEAPVRGEDVAEPGTI